MLNVGSLVKTSQDQLSSTVLELYRQLVTGQTVYKECWDFLHCSLVIYSSMTGARLKGKGNIFFLVFMS